MAWERLPENYTDAVWSGLKRYNEITNGDGTVSFQDVTVYSHKEKSFFGAKDANRMNQALNIIMTMVENGTDLYTAFLEYFARQKDLFESSAALNMADLEDYIATKKAEGDEIIDSLETDYREEITQFETTQEQVFNTWFDFIKGQFGEDIGGNLQNQIIKLREDIAASEKNTKDYADTTTFSSTLRTSGWIGDVAPYTQTITVNNLTNGVRARVFPAFSGNQTADLTLVKACAVVNNAKRVNSTITFVCLEDKPEFDIPVIVELYHGNTVIEGEDVPLLGFGGSGGAKIDLIWENTSPASSFSRQTISLNLSDYKGIFVIYLAKTGSNGYASSGYIPVDGVTYCASGFPADSGAQFKRSCLAYSGSVQIGPGTQNGTEDNTLMIPVKIYGIK